MHGRVKLQHHVFRNPLLDAGAWPASPARKSTLVLTGEATGFGCCGEENNLLSLPGIEPRFPDVPPIA
jgi:hypothetical protein